MNPPALLPLLGLLSVMVLLNAALPRKSRTARQILVIVGSTALLALWNPITAAALLTLASLNHFLARRIATRRRKGQRRRLVTLSVALTVVVIVIFTYAEVFRTGEPVAFQFAGGNPGDGLIYPFAVGFFALQSLSLSLSLHWRDTRTIPSYVNHVASVAFFPRLLAGPLEEAESLIERMNAITRPSPTQIRQGCELISRGLVKKVVVADTLARTVGDIFSHPGDYTASTILLALVAATAVLYWDIAGYTDLARGVASFFSISLPGNMDRPYLARGIGDFWRRFHTSVSSWFHHYVYQGLGGSGSKGRARPVNLFITWFLLGLWFGPSASYALFALANALLIYGGRMIIKQLDEERVQRRMEKVGAQVLTALLMALLFALFVSPSPGHFVELMNGLTGGGDFGPPQLAIPLAMLGVVIGADLFARRLEPVYARIRGSVLLSGLATGVGIALVVGSAAPPTQPFLMFQF